MLELQGEVMMYEEALFSSAHAALTFAFNFSGQQYDKSMMARLASTPSKAGKGLGGIDGAAQAGMIRAELHACGELVENVLTARMAPKYIICECTHACCSGKKPNHEWEDAIAWLTRDAMSQVAGMLSHYRLRRGIIERHFGVKHNISELADICAVSRNTVAAHQQKILKWLKGDSRDPMTGLENVCWNRIESALLKAGMVGEK